MWFNPIMQWLLRSPFHAIVSKNMMLITFSGRESGKLYTTPVDYRLLQDETGEYLATTSLKERNWWRNLRAGAPVTVRLQGKDYTAVAEVFEDEPDVIEGLTAYIKGVPMIAKILNVRLGQDGAPDPQDVTRAAQTRVLVKTRLT